MDILQNIGCLSVDSYSHEISTLRVNANPVLTIKCGNWIHSRCAEQKCPGNVGEAVKLEERFVMKWKLQDG